MWPARHNSGGKTPAVSSHKLAELQRDIGVDLYFLKVIPKGNSPKLQRMSPVTDSEEKDICFIKLLSVSECLVILFLSWKMPVFKSWPTSSNIIKLKITNMKIHQVWRRKMFYMQQLRTSTVLLSLLSALYGKFFVVWCQI